MTNESAGVDDAASGASTPARQKSVFSAIAGDDRFQVSAMGPGAFLDAGLPLVVFTLAYALTSRDLTLSLYIALGSGVLLGLVRLLRGDQVQNVVAGFLGLAIAAFWAHRTGNPEDVFLPGLLINVGYGLAFLISILVRWPLVGLFVGLVRTPGDLRHAVAWRKDPALVRAFNRATALFVVMFAARLAVQLPLYLGGVDQLGWLATARIVMGVPLFLLTGYLAWLIIRPAYRQAHASAVTSP